MATLTLMEVSEMRVKLNLAETERSVRDDSGECINCSG